MTHEELVRRLRELEARLGFDYVERQDAYDKEIRDREQAKLTENTPSPKTDQNA